MKLIYYKSDIGNFGDDLNAWLWPKIFNDFDNYQSNVDFVGIGSILDERIMSNQKTLIFGSGIRSQSFNAANLSNDLDIVFVRGPISATAFNGAKFITDAAYCLRLLPTVSYTKKYKLTYIPYFRHVQSIDWEMVGKKLNINILLPTSSVEEVIRVINESETILTTAMHGAILADIYRVPWAKISYPKHGFESAETSTLKWNDWLLSMDYNDLKEYHINIDINQKPNWLKKFLLVRSLKKIISSATYTLSNEKVLSEKVSQLHDAVEYVKQKYRL